MVLDIFCHLFQWKTSKWRVIKRLPIASDYICNSGVDFISAVISAVTRKKREMFFQQKKVISSLMLMLYTVTVVLSVSLGMIIGYHTIVEYIYPWKMFSSIHFYFYIYCKHGQRRKYGALQTLATMAELLLSC